MKFILLIFSYLSMCCACPSVHAQKAVDTDYAAYCTQSGGTVTEMVATFSGSQGEVEGYTKYFCQFTPLNGILSIGLETFASHKPSIAATYCKNLEEIKPESPLWKGQYTNPSHNVCHNLGGAIIGYAANGSFSDANGQADICVFGDGSMVSGWSLIYMANHREGYDTVKNQINSQPLPSDYLRLIRAK